MAIQSARVLADGWTLEITGEWPESTPASFQLFDVPGETAEAIATWDDLTARVQLSVTGPGHDRVGLEAQPGMRTRQIVCHEVMRAPYSMWPAQPAGPDPGGFAGWPLPRALNRPFIEDDLGAGMRRVRLRLHKPVAPGESFTVQFRAGWRAGLGNQMLAGASCVNDSVTPIERPSARWLTASYAAIRDTTLQRIDLHAAHGLPEDRRGVAGVRFCATDGTTKLFAWADLGWSDAYGDLLRCWTSLMDLTGLSPGPIAVHWSVFPWFGLVRHSSGALDPATAAASALRPADAEVAVVGTDMRAENPLIFGYDPTGSVYGHTDLASVYRKYVCIAVDPAGGVMVNPSTRAAAEALFGFGGTPAAARAAALALPISARAQNTTVALHAIRQLGRVLPPANGRGTRTNVADGIEMFMVDGLHVAGSGAGPTSTAVGEVYLVIAGNSADMCEVQGSATANASRFTYAGRVWFRDLYLRMNGSGLIGPDWAITERVRIDRVPTSSATALTSHQATANRPRWSYLATRLEAGSGTGPNYANLNGGSLLVRGCRIQTPIAAPVVVGCSNDGAPPANSARIGLAVPSGSAPESWFDYHRWNNRLRGVNALSGTAIIETPLAMAEDGRQKCERFVVVNNLFEQSAGMAAPMMRIGEGPTIPIDAAGMVIEGNTFVGNRINWMYSDMTPATIAEVEDPSFAVFYRQCRVSNNVLDLWAMKSDTFANTGANSLRAEAYPGNDAPGRSFMCQSSAQQQAQFGFMMEANAINHRFDLTIAAFAGENRGLRARMPATAGAAMNQGWAAFADDRSRATGLGGFGDYRPTALSPFLSAGRSAQIDVGADGVLRGPSFPAGAMAGPVLGEPFPVAPDVAGHLVSSTPAGLTFSGFVATVEAGSAMLPVVSREAGLTFWATATPDQRLRRMRVKPEFRVRVPETD